MQDYSLPIKGDAKPFVIRDGKLVEVEHETPITVCDTVNTRAGTK
jgi:hypothetical protein